MSFDPREPFNDLPELPPNDNIESKRILRKAISANTALANLNGLCGTIPNPNILINSIVLQEAKASSEIENIVTTSDDLYQAVSSDSKSIDPNTKEVLRYREALWYGYSYLQSNPTFSIELYEKITSITKNCEMNIRDKEVFIGGGGVRVYTPPNKKSIIVEKINNLNNFIESDDGIDPLIKAAIMHYQFEAIHPFIDGNGRAGRILILLYFVLTKKLEIPVLYLSKYIIRNKDRYYSLLRSVTEKGFLESWILYVLDAIEVTSIETNQKIKEIISEMERIKRVIKKEFPKIYSKDIVETLFVNPYTKNEFLVQKKIAERKTATKYLDAISDLGILEKVKIGKNSYYINNSLIEILKR